MEDDNSINNYDKKSFANLSFTLSTEENGITQSKIIKNDENKEINQKNNMTNINNNNNGIKQRPKIFNCLECGKNYPSLRNLSLHRKRQHNYGQMFPQKKRGRPPKYRKNNNKDYIYKLNYQNFFNKIKRINKNDDNENLIITLDIIKDELIKFFKDYKNQLFLKVDKIENYSFYKLIRDNWEKEEPNLEKESLNDINYNLNDLSQKIKMTNLDGLFFLYLKEISKNTNINYFLFIIKFIVIFREFINEYKKNLVPKNNEVGKMDYYSQIYNGRAIPSTCNELFVYLSNNNYFNLDRNELIEIVQHFCYWLFNNHYSDSHLFLL